MFGLCDVSTGSVDPGAFGGARVSSRCSLARARKADVVDDAFFCSAAAAARVRDQRPFFCSSGCVPVASASLTRAASSSDSDFCAMSLARSFGLTSGGRGGSGGGASAGSRGTRRKGQRVRSCSRLGRFVIFMISSTSGAASLLWSAAIFVQGVGMQWSR